MKKIFALILCICTVLTLASCGQTVKRPLITKNASVSGELTTVTGGNEYLPEQRSWEDWEERVKDDSTVVLKVKKVSSVSYYWDDKTGVGGITDTTVVLQKVLLGYIDEFEGFAVGEEFHLIEPFTVDKKGNIMTPKYNLKGKLPYTGEAVDFAINHDERTNPVMQVGEEYVVCLWEGWIMNEYGSRYNLECTLKEGETTIVPAEFYSAGYLCYNAFEYSEKAYNASSAIVNSYTEKGEGREDNSYNLYHAMVKEAYERFSKQ